MITNDQIYLKLEEFLETIKTLEENQREQRKELLQAIDNAQEDTIESVSELINSGFTMHEERLVKVEKHLGFS